MSDPSIGMYRKASSITALTKYQTGVEIELALEQQSNLKNAVLPTRSISFRNQSRVTNKVSPYDSDAD